MRVERRRVHAVGVALEPLRQRAAVRRVAADVVNVQVAVCRPARDERRPLDRRRRRRLVVVVGRLLAAA